MKKVVIFSVALFLIGALLSGGSYAMGGRVPDTLSNHLRNGIQFGVAHVQAECRENGVYFHADREDTQPNGRWN